MNPEKIYPRTNDHDTVYLKSVVNDPNILVGDFTLSMTHGGLRRTMYCTTRSIRGRFYG